uniref:HMG domain-containing protein n=1 Tax=Globodera rostochiensis TaxID=31243 RepID=A0A914HZV3_GLORO
MGSSSSSLSNPAFWTLVTHCGCGCRYYRAVKMEWHVYLMADVAVSYTPDTVHHAVLVYFVCRECGNQYSRTYERTSEGKHNRWGYYGFSCQVRAGTKLNVPYEIVEAIFGEMWTGQYLPNSTCRHWAQRFFNRVLLWTNRLFA